MVNPKNKTVSLILSLICGGLTPLSMAPFDWWPLAIVSLGGWLYLCLQQTEPETTRELHLTALSFAFGLGLFGVGASWVYVSIHDFGYVVAPLAAAMTFAFVAVLALLFSMPFYLFSKVADRFIPSLHNKPVHLGLAIITVYILGEWSRSWLFTGFPWLYLGYSQVSSLLAPWATIGGVLLLSLMVSFSALAMALCCHRQFNKLAYTVMFLTLCSWGIGGAVGQIKFSEPYNEAISVAMVQPNIPQNLKWDPKYRHSTMERFEKMSAPLWGVDLLVWPEAAIPLPYDLAESFYRPITKRAKESGTNLITGSLVRDGRQYYNSALGLGEGQGVYHKRRLVPFGEYVPLESWLRGLIRFFDLPASSIVPGPEDSASLQLNINKTAISLKPLICYEIAYPNLARAQGDQAILLTISNDAWFGHSIGPRQHMQIAQMRALENQRYLIRATNNGVSAIVSPAGKVLQRSAQFKQEVLQGEVYAMRGQTPFAQFGNSIVLVLNLLMMAFAAGAAGISWRSKD